jgi:hypothetical protein
MPHLFDALSDLADLALGCASCNIQAACDSRSSASTLPCMGGLVYLSGETEAMHVGVFAAPDHCRSLARCLLGQRAGSELPDMLVRGAMCELAYLLAGGVKRRLLSIGMPTAVGQPSFFDTIAEARHGWQRRTLDVELDAIRATLVCVTRTDRLALL